MKDKYMHGFLNRVYGYDDYTQQEINSKLIQMMDEVIDNCNNAFEYVDWLKDQGVMDEVHSIIDAMIEDGTIENIINKEEIDKLRNEINNNIAELTISMDTKINELKELIKQNNNELILTKQNNNELI